jgi:protein-S-isoprenylcysteine O-methyltransferase Ste14
MRAADWDFRYRFWVFLAIFSVGLSLYSLDHENIAGWLVKMVRPPSSNPFDLRLGVFHWIFGAAALLAGIGAFVRTWAAAYLRSEIVHDESLHSDRVVADGPYRHVRNPLYLGLVLAAVGLATLASRAGALVILVAVPFFTLRLIGREEAALAASGGDPYRAYCAAVPRLLPSLTPRLPPGDTRPRWGQGFAGELFFWAIALSLALFATTLKIEHFYQALGAAFVLRFLLAVLWWRRRPASAAP